MAIAGTPGIYSYDEEEHVVRAPDGSVVPAGNVSPEVAARIVDTANRSRGLTTATDEPVGGGGVSTPQVGPEAPVTEEIDAGFADSLPTTMQTIQPEAVPAAIRDPFARQQAAAASAQTARAQQTARAVEEEDVAVQERRERAANAAAGIAAKATAEAMVAQNAAQKRHDEELAKVEGKRRLVEEFSLDPDRYRKNVGTGSAIMLLLAAYGEGMLAARQGRANNRIIDQIDRAIDRDIAAQEADLEKRKWDYTQSKSLFSEFYAYDKDPKRARLEAKATELKSASDRLREAAEKTSVRSIRLNAQKGVEELDAKRLETLNKLQNEGESQRLARGAAGRAEQQLQLEKDKFKYEAVKDYLDREAKKAKGEAPTPMTARVAEKTTELQNDIEETENTIALIKKNPKSYEEVKDVRSRVRFDESRKNFLSIYGVGIGGAAVAASRTLGALTGGRVGSPTPGQETDVLREPGARDIWVGLEKFVKLDPATATALQSDSPGDAVKRLEGRLSELKKIRGALLASKGAGDVPPQAEE